MPKKRRKRGRRKGGLDESEVLPKLPIPPVVSSIIQEELKCPRCDSGFDTVAKYFSHLQEYNNSLDYFISTRIFALKNDNLGPDWNKSDFHCEVCKKLIHSHSVNTDQAIEMLEKHKEECLEAVRQMKSDVYFPNSSSDIPNSAISSSSTTLNVRKVQGESSVVDSSSEIMVSETTPDTYINIKDFSEDMQSSILNIKKIEAKSDTSLLDHLDSTKWLSCPICLESIGEEWQNHFLKKVDHPQIYKLLGELMTIYCNWNCNLIKILSFNHNSFCRVLLILVIINALVSTMC